VVRQWRFYNLRLSTLAGDNRSYVFYIQENKVVVPVVAIVVVYLLIRQRKRESSIEQGGQA
jgi:hypothetical protein